MRQTDLLSLWRRPSHAPTSAAAVASTEDPESAATTLAEERVPLEKVPDGPAHTARLVANEEPAAALTPEDPAMADKSKTVSAKAPLAQLSEYELLRLENIRRNESVMLSLGLSSTISQPRKRSVSLKRRSRPPSSTSLGKRRSARLSSQATPDDASLPVEEDSPAVKEEEEEEVFVEREEIVAEDLREDPTLKTIYSISSLGEVVAAGGKGGRVSVFGSRPCSFRGCGGWIGGVALIDESPKLLCCGNDGHLNLYDCSVSSATTGSPRLEARAKPHSSGIWSLAYLDQIAATGAKDGTVQIHDVRLLDPIYGIEDSSSAIMCVAMRRKTIATANAEGFCSFYDSRTYARTARTIQPHSSWSSSKAVSVNFVDDSRFLSSGGDEVRLWDLRSLQGKPLATFSHSNTGGSIRRPVVLDEERFALAGSNDATLSFYRFDGGQVETKQLPADATALAKHPTKSVLYLGIDHRRPRPASVLEYRL